LAFLYIYLFISSITPESAAALSNPQLADIARFFADEKAAATGWIHFLVMDCLLGAGFTWKDNVQVSGQFIRWLYAYLLGRWDYCLIF
jgi:hypothetical protein